MVRILSLSIATSSSARPPLCLRAREFLVCASFAEVNVSQGLLVKNKWYEW